MKEVANAAENLTEMAVDLQKSREVLNYNDNDWLNCGF